MVFWGDGVAVGPSIRQFVNRLSSVLDQGQRDSSSVMAVGWAGGGLIEFRQAKRSNSDIGQKSTPKADDEERGVVGTLVGLS